MSNAIATRNGDGAAVATVSGGDGWEVMERVIAAGDLSDMTPQDRARYYLETCRSMGLNPLTKPFDYIRLNNKLTLYATKGCTDQLRSLRGISPRVVSREVLDDIVVVTVEGTDRTGRTDAEIGAVSVAGLRGEALANAWMKATTKAKRRLTLSMVGLGMLDESEVETIPGARTVRVDAETGEILDAPPAAPPPRPADPPAAPAEGNGLATSEQRRRMTAVRQQLGWSQQDLQAEAGRFCGVTSSVRMTAEQGGAFVAHLEGLCRAAFPQPPDEAAAVADAEFADLGDVDGTRDGDGVGPLPGMPASAGRPGDDRHTR